MFRCRLSASQCFPGSPSVYCYQIAMRNVAPANTAALCGYQQNVTRAGPVLAGSWKQLCVLEVCGCVRDHSGCLKTAWIRFHSKSGQIDM